MLTVRDRRQFKTGIGGSIGDVFHHSNDRFDVRHYAPDQNLEWLLSSSKFSAGFVLNTNGKLWSFSQLIAPFSLSGHHLDA
jgi:hypothetical protein